MTKQTAVAELLLICEEGRTYWRPGKRPKTINYLVKKGIIRRVRKNLYLIDCHKLQQLLQDIIHGARK